MTAAPLEAGLAVAVPRLPRVYVPRLRLWRQLNRTADAAVRVLVAPVGAGKTLGVGGWARASGLEEEIRWISGDRSWTPDRLGELLDDLAPEHEGAPQDLVVIDDAHLLPPATLQLLDHRLGTDPDRLRLLLLSRLDLPFSRLVPELLGHFAVIRGDALRIDDDEARALIVEHARSDDPDVVDAVIRHAQGWTAAVVLTARAVAASADPAAAAQRFAEGDTSIAGRLAAEVFAALKPRERHLLLCIAAEERVTTETAVHLSRDDGAADVLAGLEGTGLLVSRLPEGWRPESQAESEATDPAHYYRIHPLLADIVRRQLLKGGVDVAQAQGTIRRAVRLDVASGHPESAFYRLVASRQPEAAAEVLGEHGATLLLRSASAGVAAFARANRDAVEAHPTTWFPLALDRWLVNDTESASHWLDLIVDRDAIAHADDVDLTVEHAVVRLFRARLGAEDLASAIDHARRVVETHVQSPEPQPLVPLLATELGYAQAWSGDLAEAEANLTTAVALCRTRGFSTLLAAALSKLALTLHMQGRERAGADVANEALTLLADASFLPVYVAARCGLVRSLANLSDVTAPRRAPAGLPHQRLSSRGAGEPLLHRADPIGQFWQRIRDARRALGAGSVAEAEQALTMPSASLGLPPHLRVVLLLERGLLVNLVRDEHAMPALEQELTELGAIGEAALLAGLRHELAGDRKAAAAAFTVAEEQATCLQPPAHAIALTCHAQLLDVLGQRELALGVLQEAATITELRRSAVPFLGWSHQGTPIATLLERLLEQQPSAWVAELLTMAREKPDLATAMAPVTAAPRERSRTIDGVVRPSLSAREREVLNELARGATYADIAASLFVSENTVKTHVSSLYGKLAVSRRSEALAVARNLHLL